MPVDAISGYEPLARNLTSHLADNTLCTKIRKIRGDSLIKGLPVVIWTPYEFLGLTSGSSKALRRVFWR